MSGRAVVWCRTDAGLRAGAWLARQGVEVRLLCTTSFVDLSPAVAAGPRAALEAMWGPVSPVEPTLAARFDDGLRPMPRRKRDWGVAAGGQLAWWGHVRGRLFGADPTSAASAWVETRMGPVWSSSAGPWLERRLGGPAARAPAGVARALLGRGDGEGWFAPARNATERIDAAVDAILEAGGEALQEVRVDGMEIDEGRVVGLATEFGLERVEGRLFTDLSPAELAPWSGGMLASVPIAWAQVVLVHVATDAPLPDVTAALSDGPRWLTLARRFEEGEGRYSLRFVVGSGDPMAAPDAPWLAYSLEQLAIVWPQHRFRVVGVTRCPRAVACPTGAVEAAWADWAEGLQRLGIQPIGSTGFMVPVSLADEALVLEAFDAGAVVRTQRERLLGAGPPAEPWCPITEGG